jgi:hypothetical protein
VNVRDGQIIEDYSSHWIPAIRLFDEIIRLGQGEYQAVRDQIWNWLERYPLRNNLWKGHFEDIRLDPGNENRDQVSALETARYLLQNRERFSRGTQLAKGLIDWVRDTLGGSPFFTAIPIHEQLFCYHVMGSHTARFASLSALYAEATGEAEYVEQAIRSFNWASYMTNADGTVTVGIDRPDYYNQCWFTDGYFDYVPHFIEGMASMPLCSPGDEDHMLRSSSVVQEIVYKTHMVSYRTFEDVGIQVLRLTFQPVRVQVSGKSLPEQKLLKDEPGWSFNPTSRVIRVQAGGREVTIQGE